MFSLGRESHVVISFVRVNADRLRELRQTFKFIWLSSFLAKTVENMSRQDSSSNRRPPHLARNTAIAVTAVIVIVVLLGVFFVKDVPPNSTPFAVNRVLLNGTITVDVDLYYVQFTLPANAFDVQVSGNFTVAGGNNLRVYVMNEANFNNWGVNGFNFQPDYDSGQATNGNITATLPANGAYYLVYDNRFQASQKTVNTLVNLEYFTV